MTGSAVAREPGAQTRPDSRRWLILIVLCLSALVLVVDNMALSVAVPALTRDLHAGAQDIQWILDSYMLVFAGLLLTAGSLSDRFGRRRVMIVGLTLFGCASAGASLVETPAQLIIARVVMGIGGALIMPSTLSILITVFDAEERRTAMAVWGAVSMLGLVGSPLLGGELISHCSWGAIFLINIPIVILAVVAALVLMPESTGPWRRPDPLGALLSVTGTTALVWTIIELPRNGIHSVATVAAAAVSVLALVGFVTWETTTSEPMVPLNLFRDRDFTGGSLALTLVQIGNGGLMLALTQYLQSVRGYSPTAAGLAFVPMAVASLLANTLGAKLGVRLGSRTLTVAGLSVMAAGSAVLAVLHADSSFARIAIALLVFGAGSGLALPAAVTALMGVVPAEEAGVGSALNSTLSQAGAALGVAILGSILSSRFTSGMPESAPGTARNSLGEALGVAARTGDVSLADTAQHAFTTAMSVSFRAGAVGIVAAAILANVLLRSRAPATPHRILPR
ncbi:MFS transporter [Nocardia stercoris]|uniref:DHA2 family efflux MFS transporter permease subunit n=1 Tax=Nocardia stercoris TaxID=2483361 RepID=A0A3M2L701_9NOCA|nr:MFS transporter [Nocardia stercoris]RMI32766.1 DHA2 family efflux MFS transporter permease subunit [Nocardia stercoris]